MMTVQIIDWLTNNLSSLFCFEKNVDGGEMWKREQAVVSYITIETNEVMCYVDLGVSARRKETVIVNKSFSFGDEYAFSVIIHLFFSIMTSSNPIALSFFVDSVVNLILFEECCFRRQN